MLHIRLGRLGNGLTVGNLGLAHVAVNVEFAGKAVNDDFKVQLAHTGDKGLTGFLVALDAERGVFLRQLVKSGGQSVTVALGLGLDGDLDNRIRNMEILEDNLTAFVAKGITGGGVLQADQGDDIAGAGPLDIFTLVGVHLEDSADTLTLAVVGVHDGHAGFKIAGVNAEEGKMSDEGIGEQLEDHAAEGFVVIAVDFNFLILMAGLVADGGRNVGRGGKVVDNGVQKGLHTLVAESGTAEDRNDAAVDGGLTDAGNDFLFGQFLAVEVLFKKSFILFRDFLKEGMTAVIEFFLKVCGHGLDGELGALALLVEDDGVAADKVNNAFKLVFGTNRDLKRHRGGTETVMDHVDAAEEVGADTVHLVHEADTRNMIGVGLTPHGFRLGLNTGDGIENADGAVKHTQGAFNLNREVHVAGGIDDVDAAVLPEAGRGSRGNGDAAFLFFFHPVHGGLAVVRLTDFVVHAGVIQNSFGSCGLTCVNMGHNADIAFFSNVYGAGHGVPPKRDAC